MPRPDPDVVRSIEQSLSAAIKHVIKLDIAAAQRPNFIGQCLLAQLDGNQPPSAAARPAKSAHRLVVEMPALAKICTDAVNAACGLDDTSPLRHIANYLVNLEAAADMEEEPGAADAAPID